MRIKVCCIQSVEEARLAVSAGVHALGFVSETLGGKGAIGDARIRDIIDDLPPMVATVLLTSETDPEAIIRRQRATGANTLQLPGPIAPESLGELRRTLRGISLLKVIHVQDRTAVDEAKRFEAVAHALLLDTKGVDGESERLGGTGVTHDWSISRAVVETSALPVLLAGGLRPENVADAIRTVSPFGIDACSSLRPDGRLSADRLRGFVSEASRAVEAAGA